MRILIICLVFFSSCKKMVEQHTVSNAYVINHSAHEIEIRPIHKGIIHLPTIIKLKPLDSIQVANYMVLGKGTIRTGFDSKYFTSADSVIVIFDGMHTITHYIHPPLSYALNHYEYSSTRNIFNLNSWEARTINETDISVTNEYKYRFIDKDYLDAQ